MEKKILVICADGVATSTIVASQIKKLLKEEGINGVVETGTNLSVKSLSKSFNPDLIVSNIGTNIDVSEDIPVINGMPFITGMKKKSAEQEIIKILN